jgi:lipoprotein-anchoring transpeptidase ErfK/SrfK
MSPIFSSAILFLTVVYCAWKLSHGPIEPALSWKRYSGGARTHALKPTALSLAFLLAIPFPNTAHATSRNIVIFSGFAPGTIVVKTGQRRLYFVIDGSRALRFPVGVGRAGKAWTGAARVEGKYVRPAWSPPDEIRRAHPGLPRIIAGGAANNPMGAAALTLRGGEYAIHGTNRPASIGGFVSYGCIRMYNSDIRKLYQLVRVGTPVIVEQ